MQYRRSENIPIAVSAVGNVEFPIIVAQMIPEDIADLCKIQIAPACAVRGLVEEVGNLGT